MSKRDAQNAERARIAKAADKNARPILRLIHMDGYFHVIGQTTTGKVFHEKFVSIDDAHEFAKEASKV